MSSILRQTRRAALLAAGVMLFGSAMVPGCLGRSDLENSGTVDGGAGAAGSGGSSASGGSSGSGGASGFGGSGGASGFGGSGGTSGFGGSGGTAGFGGSSGFGGSGGGNGCLGSCAGCCDASGACQPGSDVKACGQGGVQCFDCSQLGFGCSGGTCEGPPPVCDPTTCPGCCDASGLCRTGSETDACGTGGGTCTNCGATGKGCVSGKCQGTPPACGPSNCGGCCDASGKCQTGNSDTACGIAGAACTGCTASGRHCTQPGNYCAFMPTCGATTCPTGCCDASGACRDGRTNQACGASGQKCIDCSTTGQNCATQGFCYTGKHCGADNCAGCCTATGDCRAGSASGECGEYGVLCDNCTAKAQTCQGQVCKGASTCPLPYAGCNPSSVTTPPQSSKSCNTAELDALATACQGDASSPACPQYFQKLLGQDPKCYDCLLQFTGDQAYTKCIAPYLTATCNHELTCAVECSNTACTQCSASQQGTCKNGLFDSGGECRSWTSGYYCAQAALDGPAPFCTFNTGDDVGQWIRGVGQHFCGM